MKSGNARERRYQQHSLSSALSSFESHREISGEIDPPGGWTVRCTTSFALIIAISIMRWNTKTDWNSESILSHVTATELFEKKLLCEICDAWVKPTMM